MNKYNYSLTYKDNLRWRDFRAENQHFTASTPVKLDIVTFDNNNQTMLHIHNYSTTSIAEDSKHFKQTLSCIAGVGRIRFEIFGSMRKNDPSGNPEEFISTHDGLWVCYQPDKKLIYLISTRHFITHQLGLPRIYGFWHHIPLVDIPNRWLFLAIPLTIVSVK